MKSFAIVIVCYNRLPGVMRLVKQLEKADYDNRKDIDLIFSIDNSGTSLVEDYANEYLWPYGQKIVRTFSERQGLKKHILQCGEYTEQYDIVTILEDDIFVSDSFYNYAYQAAEYYWEDNNIAGISLYSFQKNWLNWVYRFEPQKNDKDTYFLKIAQSWGQVWTRNKWRPFKEWYLKHKEFSKGGNIPSALYSWPDSSWLKYHDRYCIENNKYFVYPYVSLSTNYSDPGEHATYPVTDHQVELQYSKKIYNFSPFNKDAIRYDEYMEREGLARFLGVNSNELCVSLWATKPNTFLKRYLLTTDILPYKCIANYSLSLRPIELSVIQGIIGNGIYLYDTTVNKKKTKGNATYQRLLYSMRSHDGIQILSFGIKLFINEVCTKLSIKMRKKLKRK
jgi:hypothetical protein